MGNSNTRTLKENYESRWFIWTIVFLVAAGISLVGYILLSDSGTNEVPMAVKHQVPEKK